MSGEGLFTNNSPGPRPGDDDDDDRTEPMRPIAVVRDRERDRAPELLPPSLGVCIRLRHARGHSTSAPLPGQNVVCDVCRRVVADGQGRSSCRACNVDVCEHCDKPEVLETALLRVRPGGWASKQQQFANSPTRAYATEPQRRELAEVARAVLERHRAAIEGSEWPGEFVAAEFTLARSECGRFSFVEVAHALTQYTHAFASFTLSHIGTESATISVMYPMQPHAMCYFG